MIPASFIHRSLSQSRHSASNAFYHHGKRCASHQVFVMILCLIAIVTLSYPLLLDYSQGLDYSSAANDQHDGSLFWEYPSTRIPVLEGTFVDDCQERPVVRIEQVILNATSATSRKSAEDGAKDTVTDALNREVLFHGLRLQNKISNTRVVIGNAGRVTGMAATMDQTEVSLASVCFRPAKDRVSNSQQDNCLVQSPLDFWQYDFESLLSDPHISKTISNNNHTSSKYNMFIPPSAVLRNIVRDRQSQRISSADALVLTYFILEDNTCSTKLPNDVWSAIMSEISQSNDEAMQDESWPSFYLTQPAGEAKNVIFRFDQNDGQSIRAEFLLLALGYLVVFLYISFSIGRMHLVKSKFGLGFAALAQVLISLILSLSLCSLFDLRMTLVPVEILPFLIIVIGVENMTLLTNAVVETSTDLPVRERIAQGLSKVGLPITLSVIADLGLLLTVGALGVAAVREFCAFASLALVIDYALQMSYFITILSIDLRRLELGDLGRRPPPPNRKMSKVFASDFMVQNLERSNLPKGIFAKFIDSHLTRILESKTVHRFLNGIRFIRRPRVSSFLIIIGILICLSIFYSSPASFGQLDKNANQYDSTEIDHKTLPTGEFMATATDAAVTSTAILYHASPLSLNGSLQANIPPFLRHWSFSDKLGQDDIGGGALIAAAIHHVGGWWHRLLHGYEVVYVDQNNDQDLIARAADSFWDLVNPDRELIYISVQPPWYAGLVGPSYPATTSTVSKFHTSNAAISSAGFAGNMKDSHFDYHSVFKLLLGPMLTLAGALLWLLSSLLGGTFASVGDHDENSNPQSKFAAFFAMEYLQLRHERDIEFLSSNSRGLLLSVGLDRKMLVWDADNMLSYPLHDMTDCADHEIEWPITAVALNSKATHVAYRLRSSELSIWNLTVGLSPGDRILGLHKGCDPIVAFCFSEIHPSTNYVSPPSPLQPPSPSSLRNRHTETGTLSVLVAFASGTMKEYDCKRGKTVETINLLSKRQATARIRKAWMSNTKHSQMAKRYIVLMDEYNRLVSWSKAGSSEPWSHNFDISLDAGALTCLNITPMDEEIGLCLIIAGFSDGSVSVLRQDTGQAVYSSRPADSLSSVKRIESILTDEMVQRDHRQPGCTCSAKSFQIFASSEVPNDGLRQLVMNLQLPHRTIDPQGSACLRHGGGTMTQTETSFDGFDQVPSSIPIASHGVYQRRQSQQERIKATSVVGTVGDSKYGSGFSKAINTGMNDEGFVHIAIDCLYDRQIQVNAGNGWDAVNGFIIGLSDQQYRGSATNKANWLAWYLNTNDVMGEVEMMELSNGKTALSSNAMSQDKANSPIGRSPSLVRRRSDGHSTEINSIMKLTSASNGISDELITGDHKTSDASRSPQSKADRLPARQISTCARLTDSSLAFAVGNEIMILRFDRNASVNHDWRIKSQVLTSHREKMRNKEEESSKKSA